MTEDSSVTSQHVLNDSLALATNSIIRRGDSSNIATIFLCVLGMPGNVLVFAVYVRKMITSTRVYMFALAVADLVVCVCPCLFFSTPVTDKEANLSFSFIINTSITFSMFLLVFVSIERLVAVKRPHTFSMDPQRAKKYVIFIVVASTIFMILMTVANLMSYNLVVAISASFVSISCSLIMTTCYTLMAAALLKKVRPSQNQVGIQSVSRPSKPGTSHKVISPVENAAQANDPGPSNISTKLEGNVQNSAAKSMPVTATSNIITNQSKAFKNVTMLLIITIVFIICWVPTWLTQMGVNISTALKRAMIANSVVNPFIYGVASAQFREDVRQFYRQTRIKLSTCYN
ncbi:hypothetical protein LSAT2_022498 [Lamellibrachia satsuma]|nr:hypothetical protein LSAT2_022498 [Lamellibrachia satsuma]